VWRKKMKKKLFGALLMGVVMFLMIGCGAAQVGGGYGTNKTLQCVNMNLADFEVPSKEVAFYGYSKRIQSVLKYQLHAPKVAECISVMISADAGTMLRKDEEGKVVPSQYYSKGRVLLTWYANTVKQIIPDPTKPHMSWDGRYTTRVTGVVLDTYHKMVAWDKLAEKVESWQKVSPSESVLSRMFLTTAHWAYAVNHDVKYIQKDHKYVRPGDVEQFCKTMSRSDIPTVKGYGMNLERRVKATCYGNVSLAELNKVGVVNNLPGTKADTGFNDIKPFDVTEEEKGKR